MRIRVIVAVMLCTLLAALTPSALAAPPGCPYDGNGDGRVDVNDLNHLTQNPADINGDSLADADDIACLKEYLRCAEALGMAYRPGEPAADELVPSASYLQSAVPGGLSQMLAVTRTPSPDGASCVSQMWTTTLLGTRPGLSGPIEIRLDRDGFLWQPLFADAASTSPGTTAQRIMLACEGSAIEFVAASTAMTVRSSSESRALVLLDGQNVTAMAVAKGVADAASRMIGGGLVAGYVDVDGNVSLPTWGMLVLYELDPGAASDPSFAFDDAAVLVDLECGDIADMTPQLIVLRDSIGPDISMTDGNNVLDATSSGSSHLYVAATISVTETLSINAIHVVFGSSYGTTLPITWSAFDYRINIWSSPAARSASPLHGDVVACMFDQPANAASNSTPPPTHGFSSSVFGQLSPAYLAVFELPLGPGGSCSAFQDLVPNHQYIISISPFRTGSGSLGNMGVVISSEVGDSDVYFGSSITGGGMSVISHPRGQYSGRVGYKFLGTPR